jgi:pectinesterase
VILRAVLLLMLPALAAGADTVVALRPAGPTTVQAAIDAIPKDAADPWVIELAPGIYREKVRIPAGKPPITLRGKDARIVWSDAAATVDATGRPLGTFRSATLTVEADDFRAEDIAVENAHGPGSQAVALRVAGDRCEFLRVALDGWQDTLLVERKRHYFEDCVISGHVDFIFGGATAWFERCTVRCRGNGYITAAATPAASPFGLVFHRCRVTAENAATRVFLGRPWQNRPATAFLECELPAAIHPHGWDPWSGRQATARYGEYRSSGPGARPAERVFWAREIPPAEAREITPQRVLDGWKPRR